MSKPSGPPPLGILLSRASRTAERAFDHALGGGGSRWVILRTLMQAEAATQTELAAAVGLRGATLVHHLDALEAEGLVTRSRNAENRRQQSVALTDAGRARFGEMLGRVLSFDAKLRAAVGQEDEARFRATLTRVLQALGEGESPP